MSALRNYSLREAEVTVVVGELMARKLQTFGIPSESVRVIPNWCNDEEIRPAAQVQNPLRQAWDLVDKFVLGYSGNLGRAHDFATVLAAAERLRHDTKIVFLMIGGGRRFEELSAAVKARGLDRSFRFVPYQERQLLPYSLGVADVHWVSLNPKLEGLIVPSKFYGIVAAGKPVVVIGDRAGEIAQLVQQHGCGIVIAPGDADTLVETLQKWSTAPELVSEMSRRSRAMLDSHFTRHKALERWSELLRNPRAN